ncbi:ion channel [Rhizomicrobium electricum]|uniref:ATP-sensitive inward rectifier potassium channel 10 n=1 Tax=Rhizomicrobium electricum TaxID=480070 RepID=A0ABN1FA21_9PROT|nr:ion channel [Rhizomicrobium electricum]NIJ50599.1 inward rectifier potassium channel [Rhizomicrobium electricum]
MAVIIGQDLSRWTDFYHFILTVPWSVFFLGVALFFFSINVVFAFAYMADPNGIEHARPGNFWDAFLFSVQTIGSINYSVMVPKSIYANIVVVAEAFFGILNLAVITGVVFSRFSRPYARVLFSRIAVITDFDGAPTLMFRAANQRGNQILDANITVNFAFQQTTREGLVMRRFCELKLMRPRSPLFALSWTVMHKVDEESPFHNQTPESLSAMQAELIVLLSGTDETLADTIFARHSYKPHQILWRHRFVDILSFNAKGRRVVDLTRFHNAVPDLSTDQ